MVLHKQKFPYNGGIAVKVHFLLKKMSICQVKK